MSENHSCHKYRTCHRIERESRAQGYDERENSLYNRSGKNNLLRVQYLFKKGGDRTRKQVNDSESDQHTGNRVYGESMSNTYFLKESEYHRLGDSHQADAENAGPNRAAELFYSDSRNAVTIDGWSWKCKGRCRARQDHETAESEKHDFSALRSNELRNRPKEYRAEYADCPARHRE
ncbi:hypothetical protein F01_550102 [Burkholderia cenocepacia]|nr:hypothetical protein F01_550102 [Burkholderia cenocepacia]